MSQVIEHWHSRAIWAVSRADSDYPRRLKARLREDSPAVIYGCGDISLTETGGLAVVGSRNVDESLTDYTIAVGGLAARAGRTIVSGGAKGIDQAAMRGAVEAGGKVIGVLADSLEKTAMSRDNRNLIIDGQIVLLSPYDPSSGFNVGHAMQRNKLIYSLADAALVVSADFNKGGTWAGATEQLEKLRLVPVYIRSTGQPSKGLDALEKKGAKPWPNPSDEDEFDAVFDVSWRVPAKGAQTGLELFPYDVSPGQMPGSKQVRESAKAVTTSSTELLPGVAVPGRQDLGKRKKRKRVRSDSKSESGARFNGARTEINPGDTLFAAVREVVPSLLETPMNDVEVAAILDVSTSQARAWLGRLVEAGLVEKLRRPVRYVTASKLELL